MAMKKAASKKAATKKGDEPVRVGRAKAQPMSNYIADPYGWKSTKPSDPAYIKKNSKLAVKEAKELVAYAKKKYGKNFVVTINADSGPELTAGVSKKGIKAQSARMTKQSNRITSLPKKKK